VSRRARRLALPALVLAAPVVVPAAPVSAATTRTSATPQEIRAYHRSGAWDRDVARVFRAARRSLLRQLGRPGAPRKPAIVLDIDETALSNYPCLDAVDFELVGLATCVAQGRSVAIAPARRLVAAAVRRRVRVVFITGAPEGLEDSRRANLRRAGFRGPITVIGRPATSRESSVVPYKRGARRALVRRGYRILVNVGDQRSDLTGGYARARLLVPNRIYVTT
jgi:predicted secreted acid phosphatase